MKIVVATVLFVVSFSASAASSSDGPYNNQGDPNYRYRGSSGAEYQYDRNRPRDELRYELDPKAQLRDSINVDPRRELDRSFGQSGGGARRP